MGEYNVTVGVNATPIAADNQARTVLMITNDSGSKVFWGKRQSELLTKGFPMSVGDIFPFLKRDGDAPGDGIYGQTAAGTADVRVYEEFGEVK